MAENGSKISSFILEIVEEHPDDLASAVAERFGFSRQRAHAHISRQVKCGTLLKTGRTSNTKYFRVGGDHLGFSLKLTPGLAEDEVWATYIRSMVSQLPDNVRRICAYGFTEILNNAIDHSGGSEVYIRMTIAKGEIFFEIMDNGIGIFRKITNALNLNSPREAILHLSKGKFTTDPTKHTGEGIFFTSRMFNRFSILSDDMYYSFQGSEWFLSPEKPESFGKGTSIQMSLDLDTALTPKEVFDQYSNTEVGFQKTVVAVALSVDPRDPHVSRSQAKRLMMGLEKFHTVVLDFSGVESVGQAFVDEVFRVFQNENQETKIQYTHANEDVEMMIKRGLAGAHEGKSGE